MGGQNVGLFLANGGHVSHIAFRVGVFLAWQSRDIANNTGAIGEYTRGRAFACQILFPDMKPDSAERVFTKAIRELTDAGFVTRSGTRGGRTGNYQTYTIRAAPFVDNPR